MRASQRAGKTKKGHGGAFPVQHSALFVRRQLVDVKSLGGAGMVPANPKSERGPSWCEHRAERDYEQCGPSCENGNGHECPRPARDGQQRGRASYLFRGCGGKQCPPTRVGGRSRGIGTVDAGVMPPCRQTWRRPPPKVPGRTDLPQRCWRGTRVPPVSATQVMIGAAVFAVGILAGAWCPPCRGIGGASIGAQAMAPPASRPPAALCSAR
jgi:hypothetical protein